MARTGRGWRFIDLAALGRNRGRDYALAVAQIVLYPLLLATLLGIAAGRLPRAAPAAAFVETLLRFAPVALAGAVLIAVMPRLHRRPALSLVAPDRRLDWRRVAIGGGVEFLILAAQLVLIHALMGGPWRFREPAAHLILGLAVLLIPFAAASEELFFRGYLTQALGRVVPSRVLIAVVVALLFGAAHLGAYGPLSLPYFAVISLVFSLVSLHDERLELVIGGHAAMNLFAVATAGLVVLPSAAISVVHTVVPFNGAAIVVAGIDGLLFYGLTRLLVLVCCGPPR